MQKPLGSHETLSHTSKHEYKHMPKNGQGTSFCASKSRASLEVRSTNCKASMLALCLQQVLQLPAKFLRSYHLNHYF
jgi:hypothetical protein